MKYLIPLILLTFISCNQKEKEIINNELVLIPKPQEITVYSGSFKLDNEISFFADEEFQIATNFISDYLHKSGFSLLKTEKEKARFYIEKDTLLPNEGYTLSITEKSIKIASKDASGAFYAMQTLRQLLPVSFERLNSFPNPSAAIPLVEIKDVPQFSYRGMHLDVGRHFFDVSFIKKYISYLAMLKMNYFHWHLTEDQGWRIEIKKYPNLTLHGAYRNETLIGHYNDTPQQFDGKRYGGFYTQEEIKEVVAFAQQMNITIIPEIEMPGHAQAAISAYPELGCTGKAVPIATKWGVFENIYCPHQKTFAFLKDVLEEVTELFPGEYIHIGGDEAPKTQWKNCNRCQQLIKSEGLADEAELQSYFIKEIEQFLNSKGKKLIGWDEILEGGLAPNATVMSWRGTQGGVEAAKARHPVIMTPTSHCYFDYYQSENEGEPLAIGGFLPLEKVYSFNPIPTSLSEKEAKFILGAQGNVWTEYMKTEAQVEYMIFPRILALSEVTWSGPSSNLKTDYAEFTTRVEPYLNRLEVLGVNYANHLYQLESEILKKDSGVYYALQTPTQGKDIFYSVNDSEEKKYETPFIISENTQIKAFISQNGEKLGDEFQDVISYHKGITGTVKINKEPHPSYGAGGIEALNNGKIGSDKRYGDKEWLGYWGDDLEIEIAFPKPTKVSKIKLRFYHAPGQWIYAPKELSIEGKTEDKFISEKVLIESDSTLINTTISLSHIPNCVLDKITLKIPNFGTIPDGKQGAGHKAWTFIDEIIIE